jgi:hypothetical protein
MLDLGYILAVSVSHKVFNQPISIFEAVSRCLLIILNKHARVLGLLLMPCQNKEELFKSLEKHIFNRSSSICELCPVSVQLSRNSNTVAQLKKNRNS